MLVNRGSFTITAGVEMRFSYDGGSLVRHPADMGHLSGLPGLPEKLQHGWTRFPEQAARTVLTPWDTGMRFESDDVHVQNLKSPYPLVRWTDRWGTRWSIATVTRDGCTMTSFGFRDRASDPLGGLGGPRRSSPAAGLSPFPPRCEHLQQLSAQDDA